MDLQTILQLAFFLEDHGGSHCVLLCSLEDVVVQLQDNRLRAPQTLGDESHHMKH